jgi:hypothetical protein
VLDSNTNGRPRQTTTKGTVPEAACVIKAFDSPDDGPIGPKHVEIDKKTKIIDIKNYNCIKLEMK